VELSSDRLLTPALVIDAQAVDANIDATLSALGGNADRWRPHVETAKLAWTIERLLAHLPIHGTARLPALGDLLALVPRHVCPTINLFDSAILLDAGNPPRVIPVTARGRESSPAPDLPRERL
jgi:D-serine deaminase-like pyridoxal phosphate-dependent protein